MPAVITVQTREPQPILRIRRTVPRDELQPVIAECLPAIFAFCQQSGFAFAGPPLVRYVDMRRGTFTVDCAIPVENGEGKGEIVSDSLPGGEVAVAIHAGEYGSLGDTHAALEMWASEEGRDPSGGPWESYLTDPGATPNPVDWRTEVCLPLT